MTMHAVSAPIDALPIYPRRRVVPSDTARVNFVSDPHKTLLDQALHGDAASLRALVSVLQPVVHARVGRVLCRRRALAQGDLRERALDLAQDVFVELFRDDGRALRAWDPARGLSLANWVGLIAEQRATAALRGRAATAAASDLPLDEAPEEIAPPGDDPEATVLARDRLEHVLDTLRAELSPLGMSLFQALVVAEEPIASVAERTGMSVAAVQAWSSRLKRRIASILAELSVDTALPRAS
jgi:DNA-directed RNA polymerase specialized sigma24 family protein